MRYLPNSDADRAAMLRATGHESIEALFAQIPEELRLRSRLNLIARDGVASAAGLRFVVILAEHE